MLTLFLLALKTAQHATANSTTCKFIISHVNDGVRFISVGWCYCNKIEIVAGPGNHYSNMIFTVMKM